MAVINIKALTTTWNAAGTCYNGVRLTITCSAAAVNSRMVSLTSNSVSPFNMYGNGTCAGCINGVTFANCPTACCTDTANCRNVVIGCNAYPGLVGATAGLNNISIGSNAMCNITTHTTNVIGIGSQVYCNTITPEISNLAVGYMAGSHQRCIRSCNIGYCAGVCMAAAFSAAGNFSISVGANAGVRACCTSSLAACMNLAIGAYAGRCVYACDSIAIGAYALAGDTQGTSISCDNIGIGAYAGYNGNNNNNVFIGAYAGCRATIYAGSISCYNIAIGACSFMGLTTSAALCNIAIGTCTLASHCVGSDNIVIGSCARINNNGTENIAIGAFAQCGLAANAINNCNLSVGVNTMKAVTTGSYNTVAGASAAVNLTTGGFNVSMGFNAHGDLSSGSCNTAIGYCAARFITTANNTIAVGAWSCPTNSNNHTSWGAAGINNVCNCIAKAWTVVSDCRDKTDIVPLSDAYGVEFICRLNPVKFKSDQRAAYVRQCGFVYGNKDDTLKVDKNQYGLLAQDVKNTIEELGIDFDGLGHDEESDAYRLTYENFMAPIIKTIQQLQTRTNALKQSVALLQA